MLSSLVFKADLYSFTMRANLNIFMTRTVLAAALEAFEFLMIRLSCEVEPPLLEYNRLVRMLMSRIIDKVDSTSRKKKKDHA